MSCINCTSKFLQPFMAPTMRALRQRGQTIPIFSPALSIQRRNMTLPPTSTNSNGVAKHGAMDVDPQRDDYYLPYEDVMLKPKTRKVCQKTISSETRWAKASVNPMFDNSWSVESEATVAIPNPAKRDISFRATFGAKLGFNDRDSAMMAGGGLEGLGAEEEDNSMRGIVDYEENTIPGEKNPGDLDPTYEAFHHKVLRGAEKTQPYTLGKRNRLNEWDLPPTPKSGAIVKRKKATTSNSSSSAEGGGEKSKKKAAAGLKLEGEEDGEEIANTTDEKTIPDWLIQKNALKKKLGGAEWRPRKRLSPDTLEIIRGLHKTYKECTTEKLADAFKVSPEAIRRILKSNWQPSAEDHEDRMKRWQRRKESIHQKYVDDGVFKAKEAMRQRQISKLENIYNKSTGMNMSRRIL